MVTKSTCVCLQGTWKRRCPAHIHTFEYELFPEYQFTNTNEISKKSELKQRKQLMEALKGVLFRKEKISKTGNRLFRYMEALKCVLFRKQKISQTGNGLFRYTKALKGVLLRKEKISKIGSVLFRYQIMMLIKSYTRLEF